MIAVVLAGLGSGIALLGLVAAWRPAPPSVASLLQTLDGPRSPGAATGSGSRPDRVLGLRLARSFGARGWIPDTVSSWSAAAGTPLDDLGAEVVLCGLSGVLLPPLVALVARVGGVSVPLTLPAGSSLVLGLGGAVLPILVVRHAATGARRSARAAVAGYLDLVVLCLAGGMGIEGALHAAAGIADDRFSLDVAAALDNARTAGDTPWNALSSLGDRLGITELGELAAAVRLAGTEGARIRSTLSVKAASIRRHELAEAETEANAVTERLFLPGVFLLVGFLLFVGYPAVARITGSA